MTNFFCLLGHLRRFFAVLATAALAVAGFGAAHAAEGDAWTLKKAVLARDQPDDRVEITYERYDATGGEVDLTVSGSVLDVCTGGSESLRFTWIFPADVSTLAEGQVFETQIFAEPAGAVEPCVERIATGSYISVWGSSGSSGANIEEAAAEPSPIDGDRFRNAGDSPRAYPKGYESSATMQVELGVYDPVPDQPLAYYMVRMAIFGSYEIKVVYIYEKV